MNYLISGGGTGGHIFPAISIANALKTLDPECNILFVGALDRMEMERVPQAGYPIVGLPVKGFDRQHPIKNIAVVWNLIRSMRQAKKIIKQFKPNIGIGVGGYASGAAMKVAARMGIPILLQEQNGFAGVTNKLLRNDASVICVAYEGMERFFPAEKLILTGNPVRQNLEGGNREEAAKLFGLNPKKQTLLIIGGSLGARRLNKAVIRHINELLDSDIQVIWQTGANDYSESSKLLKEKNIHHTTNILCTDFISRMDLAYALADAVISRAGASSISELCLLGKAAILVPSPNVAEDHQTHNAMALVNKHAAIMIPDAEAEQRLINTAMDLLNNQQQIATLQQNILQLAQHDSAQRIAMEAIKLAKSTEKQ